MNINNLGFLCLSRILVDYYWLVNAPRRLLLGSLQLLFLSFLLPLLIKRKCTSLLKKWAAANRELPIGNVNRWDNPHGGLWRCSWSEMNTSIKLAAGNRGNHIVKVLYQSSKRLSPPVSCGTRQYVNVDYTQLVFGKNSALITKMHFHTDLKYGWHFNPHLNSVK